VFVSGMNTTLWFSAALVAGGAVLVVALRSVRGRESQPDPSDKSASRVHSTIDETLAFAVHGRRGCRNATQERGNQDGLQEN
jgi:hypothetical protein